LEPDAQAVLDFWFGPADDARHCEPRKEWFVKDAAFDAQIRERFGALMERSLAGELAHWAGTPHGVLAQIVLLDQFPRNAFRDTTKAFVGDARALVAARSLVASGGDLTLSGVQRVFVYLPFEH